MARLELYDCRMPYIPRKNHERDASIMRAVLLGETLIAAGAPHGLSREAVRQIIRKICRDLVRIPVANAPAYSYASSLEDLRADSAAWLAALPAWGKYKPVSLSEWERNNRRRC